MTAFGQWFTGIAHPASVNNKLIAAINLIDDLGNLINVVNISLL